MGLHTNFRERPKSNEIKTREMPKSLLVVRLVIASVIFAVSSAVSTFTIWSRTDLLRRIFCRSFQTLRMRVLLMVEVLQQAIMKSPGKIPGILKFLLPV